jgi:proline iminopeptidase
MDAKLEHTDLYPALGPERSDMLDVGDGHQVYWEQSGNPNGQPVIFLHGGPGAGCSPTHRRFFDPAHYRIVLFDQRGCGKSTPHASIQNNTTDHLIADIEALRQHLHIERWLVFGGSWGSTLALAYGIQHPDCCLGFVLRGIFLGTASELDWFINGIATIFPEAHRDFKNFLPEREQGELMESYYRRLNDPDPKIHLPAAASWSRFESLCSTLLPGSLAQSAPPHHDTPPNGTMGGLAISRLETHYFRHSMFLEENFIINNIGKLDGLKAIIVQGRYDIICPPVSADKLARHWPGGAKAVTTMIVNDAGHSALEPGIRRALVQATDQFRS